MHHPIANELHIQIMPSVDRLYIVIFFKEEEDAGLSRLNLVLPRRRSRLAGWLPPNQ